MLQFADDDFIARADVFAPVTLRDEIDGLRRAAYKNNLPRVSCAQKPPHLLASAFIQIRGARRQRVLLAGWVHGQHVGVRVGDGVRHVGAHRL